MEFIPAKTIVTRTKNKAWFGTDYNMNIYKGCCHGCIYCDSRSECYRIIDFDKVRAKENALLIIRNELRRKVFKGIVGTGSMSDPYNPYEKQLLYTRHALELLSAFGFGVSIATKSPLITRDIDLLKEIQEHSPVIVKMTITTADDTLSQLIEPSVAPTSKRFEALKALSDQGIYCGILLMPILPFINDTKENILKIVEQAQASGVKFIYPSFGVTLRQNQRVYYYEKLDQYFPELKKMYQSRYGRRYYCSSPYAKELYAVLAQTCEKYKIQYQMNHIIKHYKRPYQYEQLRLF